MLLQESSLLYMSKCTVLHSSSISKLFPSYLVGLGGKKAIWDFKLKLSIAKTASISQADLFRCIKQSPVFFFFSQDLLLRFWHTVQGMSLFLVASVRWNCITKETCCFVEKWNQRSILKHFFRFQFDKQMPLGKPMFFAYLYHENEAKSSENTPNQSSMWNLELFWQY